MKKITTKRIIAVLIILLIVAFIIFAVTYHFISAKKSLINQFLSEIYTVSDHVRYQTFMNNIENWHKTTPPQPNGLNVLSVPEEFYTLYVSPFIPLTTDRCLETVVANVDHMRADQFAAENGWQFKVSDIALKKDYHDKSQIQYTFIVTINATSDMMHSSQTIVAEGNVVVVKDSDGKYKIDAYKLFNGNAVFRQLIK